MSRTQHHLLSVYLSALLSSSALVPCTSGGLHCTSRLQEPLSADTTIEPLDSDAAAESFVTAVDEADIDEVTVEEPAAESADEPAAADATVPPAAETFPESIIDAPAVEVVDDKPEEDVQEPVVTPAAEPAASAEPATKQSSPKEKSEKNPFKKMFKRVFGNGSKKSKSAKALLSDPEEGEGEGAKDRAATAGTADIVSGDEDGQAEELAVAGPETASPVETFALEASAGAASEENDKTAEKEDVTEKMVQAPEATDEKAANDKSAWIEVEGKEGSEASANTADSDGRESSASIVDGGKPGAAAAAASPSTAVDEEDLLANAATVEDVHRVESMAE